MFLGIALAKQPASALQAAGGRAQHPGGRLRLDDQQGDADRPIGVFGLMADAIGTYGFDVLTLVLKLFVVYVAAILIFGFVVIRC